MNNSIKNAHSIYITGKPLNVPTPRNVYVAQEHITLAASSDDHLVNLLKVEIRRGADLTRFRTNTYLQYGKPDFLLESVGVEHLHVPQYPSSEVILVHICDAYISETEVHNRALFLRKVRHPKDSEWVTHAREVADDIEDFHEKMGVCFNPDYRPAFIDLRGGRLHNPTNDEGVWALVRAGASVFAYTPRGRCVWLGRRTSGGVHLGSLARQNKIDRQIQKLT